MSDKIVVSTEKAPRPIAAYAQAVVANGIVYTAGQIALVPETGKLLEGGIEAQTDRVLESLKSVLEAAGSSLDQVVKTTVYLRNIEDYAGMNTIFNRVFEGRPPARTTVQAPLPLGALVEIDVVALLEG